MTKSQIILLSLLSLVGLHAEAQPARSPGQDPPSALRAYLRPDTVSVEEMIRHFQEWADGIPYRPEATLDRLLTNKMRAFLVYEADADGGRDAFFMDSPKLEELASGGTESGLPPSYWRPLRDEQDTRKVYLQWYNSRPDYARGIDRKALGRIVFSDPHKLDILNGITHPWMVEEAVAEARKAESEGKIAVINAALLESMGFVPACDAVILVTADPSTRERRALSRDGMTPERFRDRDRSQEDIGRTLAASGVRTFEIANDGDEDTLSRQVNILCAKLLEEALLWERRQG